MKLLKNVCIAAVSVIVGASLALGAKAVEHKKHSHKHGPDCGHTAVKHDDHVDYLHDGHLHHASAKGVQTEHKLAVNGAFPATEKPVTHANAHKHGTGCGHEAIPHGDHTDYVVDGKLHHVHADHCDEHGSLN